MGKIWEYYLFMMLVKIKNIFYELFFVLMCIDENFNVYFIFFDNVVDILIGILNFKWI